MLQSTPLTGQWNLKLPVIALAGYLFVLFPLWQVVLGNPWGAVTWVLPLYGMTFLAVLMISRQLQWQQLGFHTDHWKQNLALGVVSGLLLLLPLPLLDLLITLTGLESSDLFAGAQLRAGAHTGRDWNPVSAAGSILLIPLFEQVFFTGFVLQALLRKYSSSSAVYLAALIFVLLHFQFKLSTLGIGLVCSWFFMMTGSLVAPILFHMAGQAGAWLITFYYPRVVTFLGFLF